jgi:ribosomal protein L14E/L6E/L27E
MDTTNLISLGLTDVQSNSKYDTIDKVVNDFVKNNNHQDVVNLLNELSDNLTKNINNEHIEYFINTPKNGEKSNFVILFEHATVNGEKDEQLKTAITTFCDNLTKGNKTYKFKINNEEWELQPQCDKYSYSLSHPTLTNDKEPMNPNQQTSSINQLRKNVDNIINKLQSKTNNEQIMSGGMVSSESNFATLNNIINKLQNYSAQKGGKTKKNHSVKGQRKLHTVTENDDDDNSSNKKNINNAMSLMMNSRRDQLFEQFKNTILGLLEKKLITIKNKVIEPTEENASIIKSYLYRLVRDKNPTMGSFDKITILNKKTDSEIIEDLKDIPTIAELKKQMEEYKNQKMKEKEMNSDNSGMTDLPEQKTKSKSKSSKKTKDSKKSKSSKKKA